MATILTNTRKNILRNKWLSIATILVSTIVFTTASFFVAVSYIAQKAVKVSETKAQLQIYFQVETPEAQVQLVKEKLEQLDGIQEIKYISKADALALYLDYYSDDPQLVDSVSADWLPASLEVRASSIEQLENVTDKVKTEQKSNPYIEEVVYHEDVVEQIKSISRVIRTGALAIISVFSVITVALVFITISFNISAHKKEIEIMHLVGSSDSYIRLPYVFEGTVYTTAGAFLSALMILIPWYVLVEGSSDSNIRFLLIQLATELDLKFLRSFDPIFSILFVVAHMLIGAFIGFVSSMVAVMKHLNLPER